jgi:peptidoglycan/LPS O-acetylase OafA/YrhL
MLKNRILALGVGILALAFIQVVFYNNTHNYAETSAFQGIDIQLIQKIIMCYFFMMLFQKFKNIKSAILNVMASTSFAIYFIHFVMVEHFIYYLQIHRLIGIPLSILTWTLYTVSFTTISILIALTSKKIFGSWSRYLIGY